MEKNDIGLKIQQLRKNSGMSQQKLADKLCVSNKTISKWECGNGVPDIEMINKIAAIFHISVDEIINENEENNENSTNTISNNESIDFNEPIQSASGAITYERKTNKNLFYIIASLSIFAIIAIASIVCFFVIPKSPEILKTNNFLLDKNSLSLSYVVDKDKSTLNLSNEFEIAKHCSWGIFEDAEGKKELDKNSINFFGANAKFSVI